VDEEGKPIVGAKVTRDRDWHDLSANETTGAAGRFRFANVAKAELILTVQADGFVAQDRTVDLVSTNELRFELSRAAVLRGTLVEESGKPIPQATIVARGGDFDNDRFAWFTSTDEQGKFAWLSVPPLHKHYDVYADGFAATTNLALIANGVEQQITLRATARIPRHRISGSVMDAETRQPVDNLEVWVAFSLPYQPKGAFVSLSPELRTTGMDGKFAFLTSKTYGGRAENYAVEVRAEGYAASKRVLPGRLTNDLQLSFALQAGAGLTGIVQSPEGQPVGGAVVLICAEPGDGAYMVNQGQLDLKLSRGNHSETDTNGVFTIRAKIGTGTVFIAHKSGFAQMPITQLMTTRAHKLQPWGQVTGLLMIGRQPGTNETVCLGNVEPWAQSVTRAHLAVTTDVDGHFSFGGLPPGEWRISHELRHRGHPIAIKPLTQTFTIQVSPGRITQVTLGGAGRKVVGVVSMNKAGQGTDLEGCLLTLTSELPGLPVPRRDQFASSGEYDAAIARWPARKLEFQNSPAGIQALGHARKYLALVEADGSFAINDVLPGAYELEVEFHPGGIRELSSIRPDPLVMNWLDGLNREVVVSDANGNEAEPVDLGILEPNLNKVGQHQQ
jgi:hypothetical protein